ncbi:MAG: O-antigen ligase family protein [Bacteroides sp.]|nr:O-antigen ligase family protein [Bacteroides sp.]
MLNIRKIIRDISFWKSLQTIVLVLLLLDMLVPVPPRFTTYAIGVGFIVAFIHWCLLPWKEKWNQTWKYALPYAVFYALMLVSGFFSDSFFLSLQELWRYAPLLFIPLIFVGMTPAFFSRKRIRTLAFALIFGVLAGYLWRVGVLMSEYARPGAVKELGWNGAFHEFYTLAMGIRREWTIHPAFEALFGNLAVSLVLVAWVRKDAFFGRGCNKALAVVYVLLISINILLFCTKTSALCCAAIFFSAWIYAFRKKEYRSFALMSAVVLVFAGSVLLLSGKGGGMLRERYRYTENAIKSFVRNGGDAEADGSFMPRLYCHWQTWDMFREKPVMGWGPAYGKEFQARFRENYDIGYPQEGLRYPHNEFLEVALIGGVFGLSVLVWILLSALQSVRHRKDLCWWLWFGCLIVFFIVESIFDRTIGFIYLCGFHGILFCQDCLASQRGCLPEGKPAGRV